MSYLYQRSVEVAHQQQHRECERMNRYQSVPVNPCQSVPQFAPPMKVLKPDKISEEIDRIMGNYDDAKILIAQYFQGNKQTSYSDSSLLGVLPNNFAYWGQSKQNLPRSEQQQIQRVHESKASRLEVDAAFRSRKVIQPMGFGSFPPRPAAIQECESFQILQELRNSNYLPKMPPAAATSTNGDRHNQTMKLNRIPSIKENVNTTIPAVGVTTLKSYLKYKEVETGSTSGYGSDRSSASSASTSSSYFHADPSASKSSVPVGKSATTTQQATSNSQKTRFETFKTVTASSKSNMGGNKRHIKPYTHQSYYQDIRPERGSDLNLTKSNGSRTVKEIRAAFESGIFKIERPSSGYTDDNSIQSKRQRSFNSTSNSDNGLKRRKNAF